MGNQIKIGFIQATNKIDVQWFKPLAFGYLKSYLDANLGSVVRMDYLTSLKKLENYNIIAISSTSQDFTSATAIALEAKRTNNKAITILGGHHVTYLPSTMSKAFDLGVLGEGEETLLELVHYFIKNGLNIENAILRNIKGLAFHENDRVTTTGRRELMRPLDKIPHPFREPNATPYLFTSRGCPYKCSFCSSSAFWEETRFFSAEYVVEEIEQILEKFSDTRHITMEDDLFIVNKRRFRKVIDLMEERSINKQVALSFAVRANLVTEELSQAMKKMNVQAVCFGAESASDRILTLMKKNITVAQNQRALDILFQHGINTACSFIVGWPTETEEEVRATYEFLMRNISEGKLTSGSAVVNILMPMPGTEIWSQAARQGIIEIDTFDWNRLAAFASYKHSNIDSFSKWVEYRRAINSIYLNEKTLPQERLYEIMCEYEDRIKSLAPSTSSAEGSVSALQDRGQNPLGMSKVSFFMRMIRPLVSDILKAVLSPSIIRKALRILRQRGLGALFSRIAGRLALKKQYTLLYRLLQKTGERICIFPESALAHKYCIGKGLEIGGAAHNPFGLNTLNVDFTDSMETEFKKEEIRCCGRAMKVDIVAHGDNIPLPAGSQDFVVSSHVLEHFPNPIKALLEWDRLLRPGGIIFMIVPHKERTFDKNQTCTSLQHLIEDFLINNKALHNNLLGHDHCWITEDIVALVNWMIDTLHVKWEIAEVQDVDDKVGNGFTVVIRKKENRVCEKDIHLADNKGE